MHRYIDIDVETAAGVPGTFLNVNKLILKLLYGNRDLRRVRCPRNSGQEGN